MTMGRLLHLSVPVSSLEKWGEVNLYHNNQRLNKRFHKQPSGQYLQELHKVTVK